MLYLNSIFNSDMLKELVMSFVNGVPRFLMAIVVLIIGIIVSKIVRNIIKKVLVNLNVDKIGEKLNEIEVVEKSNVKIKISTILSKLVYFILMLFFFAISAEILSMPAVTKLVTDTIAWIPNIVVAGIILIIGTLFADMLKSVAQTTLESLGIPSARLLSSFLFYFLLINIVVSALTQAQIETDFLSQNIAIIFAGIILAFAIGYGLASRTSMSNFLASYYTKGKFDVGDTITLDGVTGKVVEIDKSSLIVMSDSGNKFIIPLSHMTNNMIEIHTNN